MMKRWAIFYLCFIVNVSYSQAIKEKLTLAIQQLEADPQLRDRFGSR